MNDRPKRSIKPPSILKEYEIEEQDLEENLRDIPHGKLNKRTVIDKHIPLYKCKKCHTKYNNRREFILHIRKHRGKEFLCEDCGKTLSSLQSYIEHSNIHKNLKPYKCEVCGHESRQISVHSRHLLIHETNPGQVFKCSICSKTFKLKEYLKQHMRKHLGEKPYQCEACKKNFTTKSELNRHLACHSTDRPHICHHCNRTFKLKHNLNAHIKAHTKKQLWKCCLCKASFPQQCMMEKHKKTHAEVIQHVELVKNDTGSLSITSLPLDRRKVLHHQNISLPSDINLNDSQNKRNSNVSLGLNDVFIPFSIIANSFGTGDYIKMKIVDRVNMADKIEAKKLLSSCGVTNAVVVEKEKSNVEAEDDSSLIELDGGSDYKANVAISDQGDSYVQENLESTLKHELTAHFESFKEVFKDTNLEIGLKINWVCTYIKIMKEFNFPFDLVVSQYLHQVVGKLQSILIISRVGSFTNDGSLDLHAPSCESCGPNQSPNGSKTEDLIYDSINTSKESNVEMCSNEESNKGRETLKIQVISSDNGEGISYGDVRKMREIFKLYVILNDLLNQHLKIVLFTSQGCQR